jgi:hypothetical protein
MERSGMAKMQLKTIRLIALLAACYQFFTALCRYIGVKWRSHFKAKRSMRQSD